MEICTAGFTQRSAEDFFETLREANVRRLVDVRLHNTSQLAGFAKRDDLRYFLEQIVGAHYVHEPLLAPTPELLAAYRKSEIPWSEYEARYVHLITDRRIEEELNPADFQLCTVLLCSEHGPEHCHRRLIAEYLSDAWGGLTIVHL